MTDIKVTDIKVPDIGEYKEIPVIEILVKPGDRVKAEDTLVTLESDKATMDVPTPVAGLVREVKVRIGDRVSEGSLIVTVEAEGAPAADATRPSVVAPPAPTQAPGGVAEVRVPDVGDFKDIPVIEIFVKPGDVVKPEQSLVSLESDKATMDVPAPLGGTVREVRVKLGDKVSQGTIILTLDTDGSSEAVAPTAQVSGAPPSSPVPAAQPGRIDEGAFALAYASPAVRKLAREHGVDLGKIQGSGDKGRILMQDVERCAAGERNAPASNAGAATTSRDGLDLLPWPQVNFARFGPIESKPLSRIKKLSAANLHRNWVMIPHVTNHDDADITELEAFRVQINAENEKSGVKISMLAFMIKAAVASLRKFPEFNASLDGDNLIIKHYYHIGFAADTPQGLVVPVIRDADKKGVLEIAKEMSDLARLARDGKLKADQMQGGSFTISSLGGIGGIYFTPIINAPEVAIMGVCRSFWKQVSPDGRQSAWRYVLPLSLSWDHRVIDGATAARFNAYFASVLGDPRRILL